MSNLMSAKCQLIVLKMNDDNILHKELLADFSGFSERKIKKIASLICFN